MLKQSEVDTLMDNSVELANLAMDVTSKLQGKIAELTKERDMYKEDFDDLWYNVNNMKFKDRLIFLIKGAK